MRDDPTQPETALRTLLGREPLVRSLGNSLPAGAFIADPAGRCIYANPQFAAMCGVTTDAALGQGWAATLHPDDRARVLEAWAGAVARGEEWHSEHRCVANGTVRTVSIRSAPVRGAAGAIAGHVAAAEDITTRARLQFKLTSLVAASRTLLESPRLGAVLPATMGVAQQMIAADGYAVWRLREGRHWQVAASTGISAEYAAAIIDRFQGAPASPVPFTTPLAIEDAAATAMVADRQSAYEAEGIRSMLVVPLNIGGTMSGTLVFYYRSPQRFDDIRIQTATALGSLAAVAISTAELYEEQLADRQRMERAHQQATFLAEASIALGSSLDYEATLKAVAALAVPRIADWCAVDILDANGEIRRLAVAHVDPAKVEFARTFSERYPEDPESPHSMRHILRTGQPAMMSSIPDELLVQAARDEEHLRAMRALGLTSYIAVPLVANGRTLGVMTFVSAESGRRYDTEDLQFAQAVAERAALAMDNARAYSAARAANRAKDEFLATLSHELRTPINAIMGWAQMLQHGAVEPPRVAQAVDAILRNASSQARLIEDLLDLSRITSGKLRLEVELVDMRQVVASAVATVEPAAQAKGIRIQTIADDSGARVYGDRQRLQQAVWNLLSNAVKFTPKGGRVQVNVLRVNSHLEIVVSDTGEGIDTAVLPFIFDRFRQGDSTSTRRHTGLGLGLAIVRHIVELHGGTVTAASDGPGTGATFRVKLPVSVAKPAALAEPNESRMHPAVPAVTTESLALAALPALTGVRILVVEDDPDAREMVAHLLRHRNADVVVVESVDAALQEMDARVPDVLVSDVEMPGRDGYDFIRTVRARLPEQGGMVPAVALTAYSRPLDRARSMLSGYDAHLAKPVDLAELIATIVRLKTRAVADPPARL